MSSELVLRKNWCGSSESRLEAEGRVGGLRVNTRAEGEYGDCEPIRTLIDLFSRREKGQ